MNKNIIELEKQDNELEKYIVHKIYEDLRVLFEEIMKEKNQIDKMDDDFNDIEIDFEEEQKIFTRDEMNRCYKFVPQAFYNKFQKK